MVTVNGFGRAWAVTGSRQDAQIMRVLAYMATNGSEGVAGPADCKVRTLSTPGAGVRIDPGALLVRNRSSGARNQSYVADGASESTLDLVGTSGQGARQDLVVLRIEDQDFSPWPDIAASTELDYKWAKPFQVQNVPSGTIDFSRLGLGYSAYGLARIEWPSNTTVVSADMIKDVRELAQAHSDQHLEMQPTVRGQVTTAQTSWHNWPTNSIALKIPRWCTTIQVQIGLNGIHAEGPADVNTRVQLGNLTGPVSYIDYNGAPGTSVGFVETLSHGTYAEFDVRALAGTVQTLRLNAKRDYTQNTGRIEVFPEWSQETFDVRFLERLS